MPKYWKISNRSLESGIPSSGSKGGITYWVSDGGPLDQPESWTKASANQFKTLLLGAVDQFPNLEHGNHENQSQVALFVHGYNVDWKDAARRYEKLCGDLFNGGQNLGICVSFDWPSCGSILGYLPDRAHARECAADLADVLSDLFEILRERQLAVENDTADACKAKVALIGHSMGNYLTQKALSTVWTRKNQPLSVSLINQLVMVAADVDNDLFEPTGSDSTDGNAVANLSYRVTALYSGRDAVLGASAGLKHFGTRRLGRSGLSGRPPGAGNPSTEKDNVWDLDCSSFFPGNVDGMAIHSAYFETSEVILLMADLLRGIDRSVLTTLGRTTGSAWPPASINTSSADAE